MKLKNILSVICILLAVVSCSMEDEVLDGNSTNLILEKGAAYVTVDISTAKATTKAVGRGESHINGSLAGDYINSCYLLLLDNDGNIVNRAFATELSGTTVKYEKNILVKVGAVTKIIAVVNGSHLHEKLDACTTLSQIRAIRDDKAEHRVKVGEGTIVIISSVTGTTSEIVDGVKKAQKSGARVIGFIDVATAELAKLVDYVITYPANEQLKFYMVADRFMYNAGEFPEYEDLYKELDQYLATALVEVEKEADAFGEEFANRHKDDKIHYFVGAGNQYGATYSYAMCYWEEQHWIRTKSIHSAEFFHGMLEIIDKDTPVTVFIGEDSQRSLSERVANFLPRICGKYNIIDTKKFELKGISPEYRGYISHLVMHAVTQRIDVHMEKVNCHPMEIRRYYRCLDY